MAKKVVKPDFQKFFGLVDKIPIHEDAITEKIGDITIDTVWTHDTNKYETGIFRGKWIIVEQYDNPFEAADGHFKWCNKIRLNPQIKLKDIYLGEEYD